LIEQGDAKPKPDYSIALARLRHGLQRPDGVRSVVADAQVEGFFFRRETLFPRKAHDVIHGAASQPVRR